MKKIFDKLTRAVDRIISGPLLIQFIFFLLLVILVFTLLFVIRVYLIPHEEKVSSESRFWDTVLNFLDVGGYEDFSVFERWIVLLTNLCGMVIFAGVLVAFMTNTIYQRIDNVKNGEVYYSFSDHVVIIGYDKFCDELAAQLVSNNELVIMTSQDVSEVRHELFNSIHEKLRKKIFVVNGSRTMSEDIEKLNIQKCRQIFLLGDMNEDAHDSKNIECLELIKNVLEKSGKFLQCHVLFEHHSTFAAFQQQEISGIREHIDLIPFNFCDMWAQKVFVKNAYNGDQAVYKPLDHKPIKADSQMRVHLVILGMSEMGISLGLQAAQICHFPNFVKKGIKTRVTFIDKNADTEMNSMKVRLQSLFEETDYSYACYSEKIKFDNKNEKPKFTDIEFEFIKAHFEEDEVQQYIKQAAADENSYLTIAVALRDSYASFKTALYLPSFVFETDVSVLVRQEKSSAIVAMLSEEKEGDVYRKYRNLRSFGMLNKCYELKEADELLPMMVKYAYDKTSFSEEQTITEFDEAVIRDNWKNNWARDHNMPALKASNRYAANFIPVKQRSLDIKEGVALNTEQINLAARIEHNRWVMEKLLVGFRAPTKEEAVRITKETRAYYKARFIHEDIKGYQELGEDAKNINVKLYDINISRALPYMLKSLSNK